MIRVKQFTFNNFMVNTYLLWDETKKAVIIDAACYDAGEQDELLDFLKSQELTLCRNLNTHGHIDHVLGNEFIRSTFALFPEYHAQAAPFMLMAKEMGESFGFRIGQVPKATNLLTDNQIITWGNSSLKVLYTPGHAEGSVCFYSEADGFVVTGDVLFKDTIGRTDLPTGDFDQLMTSIHTRLFTLPPDTVIYPGHGPDSTIGYEMAHNPFIR